MGKKSEGRKIKSRAPMDSMMPFIMPSRNDSANSFSSPIEITKSEQYIHKKREEGLAGFGMMHVFMAAYVRVISEYPGLNRFIRGQRLYARNGIEICLTIKKEMKLNAPETVVKLFLTPYDTSDTIYEKLKVLLEENRKEGDQNDMDVAARAFIKLPGFFLKFVIWLLKVLDYIKLLPRFLTKLSPFHGSIFITNLGSLGIPPVRHHLYEFGNLPLFLAIGKKYSKYELNKTGEAEKKRYIDFVLTLDERICDGHYFARGFKRFKRLLENPEELDIAPETVTEDIR